VAVLLPEGLRPVWLPETVPVVQPGLLMELRSARPVALRRERAQAVRSAAAVGPHRGLEMPARPARPSAAVARKVQARRQEALRLAEPAVQAGVSEAEPQQEVLPASAARRRAARAELAVSGAGALRPEAAAAVWDAAAGQQREAAAVQGEAVVALLQAAAVARAAVAAAWRPGAAPVSEVLRRAGRDEPAEPLLAAAWAALPSIRCRGDQPAPSVRARSAHARRALRTARP
jgi:hypothetical protein